MARAAVVPAAGCNRRGDVDTTSTYQSNRKDVMHSIPRPTDPTHLDPIDAAGIVSGTFAVVVKVDDEHRRRRLFLSLSAAEKAVERAHARGQGAEIVLCRLAPVTGWTAATVRAQGAA